MKKTTLTAMALLCCASLTAPAFAQESPTATSEIYDFSGFGDKQILDLFYNALQQGRNYPTQAEFEAAGIQASDLAFIRSHVRRAAIMSRADRLLPATTEGRALWMNIPTDVGQDGKAGFPGSKFSADVYSMWNYTNLFGSWNHAIFTAPGCWVDAAHRNGTDIMSGIKFFESWTSGSGDASYTSMITQKNDDGTFKYVKPLINALMFFGSDGINYNWEDSSYSQADCTAFHKALYKEAAAQGFTNFHAGIYTASNSLTPGNSNALFGNSEGRTFDLMLNYMGGDFTSSSAMALSVNSAKSAMGTVEGLYSGVWIASMDRNWSNLSNNPEMNVCLWGEHAQSRFFSYNSGSDAYDAQGNYQRLLERGFSGGYRNPATRPAVTSSGSGKINWEVDSNGKLPLSEFCGLAEFIPERSAIQGDLHFLTHFTLGNGDRYYYKGKQSAAGNWYNMGAQDLVPTYRWLVYKANTKTVSTDVQPNYTHLDAYTGGSSLELSGKATATGTDIVMYKTNLTMAGSAAFANVAVKSGKEGKNPTNLYLILKVKGSDAWKEYAVGETEGKAWEEKRIDLGSLANGDVVEYVGFRVKGSDDAYKLLLGKLELNCNSYVTPSEVKDLNVEVKEETKNSMSMKLFWNVDKQANDRKAWDLLYNDEANIHHFEVLYKNGEDGRVAEVARTSSWATFVSGITFENATDQPYIGVRAVATDLQTYSPVVWVKVPRADQSSLPESTEEDTYGVSAMDPACEGAAIARQQRYVTEVTTTGADQDINYTASAPVADGSQYCDQRNTILKVQQGQTVSMTIKCADFSDGLKWCFAGGWLDMNGSGTFDCPDPMPGSSKTSAEEYDPMGERIFRVGNTRAATPEFQGEGIKFSFTVPTDATPGKSRLRIVFSDAWFAGMFLPTGLHAKGFTIDFGAEISGSNPGRSAADTRDQGAAEEPVQLEGGCTAINQVVNNGEASTVAFNEGALNFTNVEKAWLYSADGKFVSFMTNNPTSVSTANLAPGVYLVKMQSNNVLRSQKVVIK